MLFNIIWYRNILILFVFVPTIYWKDNLAFFDILQVLQLVLLAKTGLGWIIITGFWWTSETTFGFIVSGWGCGVTSISFALNWFSVDYCACSSPHSSWACSSSWNSSSSSLALKILDWIVG